MNNVDHQSRRGDTWIVCLGPTPVTGIGKLVEKGNQAVEHWAKLGNGRPGRHPKSVLSADSLGRAMICLTQRDMNYCSESPCSRTPSRFSETASSRS